MPTSLLRWRWRHRRRPHAADYLGYIYGNTPDICTNAKDFLLQNTYKEELADIRHTDLLNRFAEACGTTRERVEDRNNANAVTRGLPAWCYATSMREPRCSLRSLIAACS